MIVRHLAHGPAGLLAGRLCRVGEHDGVLNRGYPRNRTIMCRTISGPAFSHARSRTHRGGTLGVPAYEMSPLIAEESP